MTRFIIKLFVADWIDHLSDLILYTCSESDIVSEGLLKGELCYRSCLYFFGGKCLGGTDHIKCAIPEIAKVLFFLNKKNKEFKFLKIRSAVQSTTNLSESKKSFILSALEKVQT